MAGLGTPGDWRKSQRSGDSNSCVEWRRDGDGVEIRDSKDRSGPVLRLSEDAWQCFVAGVKHEEFDLPN